MVLTLFLAQDEYKNPAHDDWEGVLCACGKDLAACGACGRGYAQRGGPQFGREVASRTVEGRKRQRDEIAASGDGDQPGLQWDTRGRPAHGPDGGGPWHWHGQKWRSGSCRYANAGGKHREKYQVWHKKKAEGLTGQALAYFHPFQRDGYWERQARAHNIPSPRDEKEARERAEKYDRARLGAWV